MRHLSLLALLAVVALAGCDTAEPSTAPPTTTSTAKPTTTIEVEPLPEELTGPPPTVMNTDQARRLVPDAPESAPLRTRAEQTLRQATLIMASVNGRVTASCTADVSRCSSTYNGLTIPWGVLSETTIEPRAGLPGAEEYTFLPQKAIVTAASAYHEIWPTDPLFPVRCDELPRAFVAKTGVLQDAADTGYRCQTLQAPDENTVRRWRTVALYVEEDGSTFWS